MVTLAFSAGEVLACRMTLSGTRGSLWKADSFMVELIPLLGVLFTKAWNNRKMLKAQTKLNLTTDEMNTDCNSSKINAILKKQSAILIKCDFKEI